MSEYKKEDIKNLHYNNNNEIQYEYGGQIYHCSMEHLKEVLVTCWNLQQEKQQLKEVIDEVRKIVKVEKEKMGYAVYDSCLLFIEEALDKVDKER